MKREQIEKIARAALQLREAIGVASMSASHSEYGDRVTFYPDSDEEVQAICGVFHQSPETCRVPHGWWLFANIDLDGLRLHVIGPTHRNAAIEIVEGKLDAAVEQAEDAIGGAA